MGNRGRFGKYGETKRFNRLRRAGKSRPTPHELQSRPSKLRHDSQKTIHPKARVKIRSAGSPDAPFIGQLSGRVFHIYGPYEDIVFRWFQLDITTTIIATMDKKPVGFAMIGDISNRWDLPQISELLAIAVEPERQGMGVGDILIREAESKALEFNIKRIFLHTAVNNLSARKLFTKNGYRIWEIKENFYPKGQDAVMMSKEIGESLGKSR
jgi:ribosomal protein S18 acetylase RimI-like enzyme